MLGVIAVGESIADVSAVSQLTHDKGQSFRYLLVAGTRTAGACYNVQG
jgi:hypothetical protein